MNKKVVILLAGPAGVGKNTFAEKIDQELCLFSTEYEAFADPIKMIARAFYNWDGSKEGKGRTLLQEIGASGRHYNPDIWAGQLARRIYQSQVDVTFVTDLRYDNEYRVVRDFYKDYPEVLVISIKLKRTFKTKLTSEQIIDSSELGISTKLMDHWVDLDSEMCETAALGAIIEKVFKHLGVSNG